MNDQTLFSLRLSLQVACVAVVLLVITAVPLAHWFARHEFRGKRVLESVLSLPLVLPPTVLGYYLVVVLGARGLVGGPIFRATGWTFMFNWWGAVVAAMAVAFPLLFHMARIAIGGVDRELEQAASAMGASKLQVFRYITIPLARRGLLAGIALAFARAMGEFGATLMIAGNVPGKTNTMPLAIYNAFSAGRFSEANLLAAIYIALCLLVLVYISSGGLYRQAGRD